MREALHRWAVMGWFAFAMGAAAWSRMRRARRRRRALAQLNGVS